MTAVLPRAASAPPTSETEGKPAAKGIGFHIPELDGLRGVAILLVVVAHVAQYIQLAAHHTNALLYLLSIGWGGVDLFFVLSGFLITSVLLRADKTKGYFSTFYLRRVLRIFPLYYAYLIGSLLYGLSLKDTWWFWLYVGNWRQAFAGSPRGFHHLWSLSIEEQFYFLWPMVIFLVPARKLWMVCLAVFVGSSALSLAYEMNGLSPAAIYFMTPFRMGALALGGLLAALDEERIRALLKLFVPLSVLSLFGLFWMFVATPSWPATIGYVLFAVGFCGMVAECVVRRGSGEPLVSLLRNPVLRSFGKYSYAIYVLHLVVVAAVFPRLWGVVSRLPFGLAALACILLMMALFYVAGMLSWYVLERHFLALKDRIPQTERV